MRFRFVCAVAAIGCIAAIPAATAGDVTPGSEPDTYNSGAPHPDRGAPSPADEPTDGPHGPINTTDTGGAQHHPAHSHSHHHHDHPAEGPVNPDDTGGANR